MAPSIYLFNTKGGSKGGIGKQKERKQKTNTKMANINQIASIITLNVKGLNIPIKRQKLADWIKEQDLTIRCPEGTPEIQWHKLKVKYDKRYTGNIVTIRDLEWLY